MNGYQHSVARLLFVVRRPEHISNTRMLSLAVFKLQVRFYAAVMRHCATLDQLW